MPMEGRKSEKAKTPATNAAISARADCWSRPPRLPSVHSSEPLITTSAAKTSTQMTLNADPRG